MTDDKTSPQPTADTPAKKSMWRHIDVFSGLAFLGGGLMSLGGIINNIHNKFYQAVVLGYGEVKTVFSDIVQEYLGDYKLGEANTTGKFSELHEKMRTLDAKFKTGALEKDAFQAEIRTLGKEMGNTAKSYRRAIEDKIEAVYNIKTRGAHWFTDGAWKRAEHLGVTARREAGLAIAAVTAVGLGTAFLLRAQKHSLDVIEDKLDQISAGKSR